MEDKITEKQLSKIHYMYDERKMTEDAKKDILHKFGKVHTNELSKLEASTLIDELSIIELPKELPTDNQSPIIQSIKPVYEPEVCTETALAPLQNMGIVRPLVSAEQAVMAWKEYEQLKQRIISADDLQKIGDKEFIKKSGWRKLATCFNLSDDIVEETKECSDGGFLWRIKVKVTAQNGRTAIGVGICDSRERSFAHKEHDVYATAHTRAKNRSISDMIGGGSVSAEEMGE